MTKCLLIRRRRGELKVVKCVTVPRGSYSKQYIGEPVASTVLLRSLGAVLEMLEERETVWMGLESLTPTYSCEPVASGKQPPPPALS